jgi:Raf kinase inhibitor-like YbhB/YbcL family protein
MKHLIKEVDYKLLKISSSAFKENEFIPVKYTCDGENVSPPLDIEHIPEEAKSLAIIVDDPDAPVGTWVHWVMWNVPVTHHFKENEVHGIQGMNDFSNHAYGGPCPPGGTHRYFFKVYALDNTPDLPVSSTKYHLEKAMSGHILAFGELVGLYKRNL